MRDARKMFSEHPAVDSLSNLESTAEQLVMNNSLELMGFLLLDFCVQFLLISCACKHYVHTVDAYFQLRPKKPRMVLLGATRKT